MPAVESAGADPRLSPLRLRGFLLWLAVVLAIGLLLFTYHYLDEVVGGGSEPAIAPLIRELSAAFAGGVLFFGIRWLVRRFPLTPAAWARRLPLYLAALPVFAVALTSAMWGLRELLYPLAGLGDFDYGAMPLRYLMELPMQALSFTIAVGALHAVAAFREARAREVREAKLQQNLAQAELRALGQQLQPHFLFNTLNAISETMYRDPEAADEMLDRLAELLRASLTTARTDEVPLAAEIELLERYLELLRLRFGDRLRVTTRLDPGVSAALVPPMLLQPLVENAVRHGGGGPLAIELSAERRDGRLVLVVADDGAGAPAGRDPLRSGLGLSATAERLELLYGAEQEFAAGNAPGGGFRVEATIPYRTAAEPGR